MIKINLDEQLQLNNMKQAELAEITGIRPSTICDMYNNNCCFLKLEYIEKIVTVLNCSISDLISII